jgi:GNAT superfamily N-acetyltransferase
MDAPTNPALPAAVVVRVRAATPTDAEALVQLINAAFVVEQPIFDGDRVDLQGVHALIDKGTFLVAADSTSLQLSGCVYLEPRGERCYLGLLSVAPSRQGKGLGRQLAAAAEEFARNAGCHTMDLRIISPRLDSLLPLYKRLGYTEAGTAPFPADVPTKMPGHYVLMVKALE